MRSSGTKLRAMAHRCYYGAPWRGRELEAVNQRETVAARLQERAARARLAEVLHGRGAGRRGGVAAPCHVVADDFFFIAEEVEDFSLEGRLVGPGNPPRQLG